MENNIKNSNIYKRLRELRVDFAYSKNLYFTASNRVSVEESKLNSIKTKLEVSSILISVITLSSVAFYFSQEYKEYSVIIIGVLSILGVLISVYSLTLKNKNSEIEYIKTANGYLDLYKKTKIIEARVEDDIISIDELVSKVEELTFLQSKLLTLKTIEVDFDKAKIEIEKGSNTYKDTDFDNT